MEQAIAGACFFLALIREIALPKNIRYESRVKNLTFERLAVDIEGSGS